MKNLSRIQKIVLALLFLVIFVYSFRALNESDNFYHIKTGQVIWETKSVPHQDVFSYTAVGAQWVTHEWLAELVFYGIYTAFGFWGLMAFAAGVALISYSLLLRLALLKRANFFISCILVVIIGIFTFKLWVVRPHIFGYLGLVILIWLLEKYRTRPRLFYLWLAAIDVLVWANMHASFILGIVIMAFYGLAELLEIRWSNFFGKSHFAEKKWPLLLLLFAFLAGVLALVNPNTYRIFLYSFAVQPVAQALHGYEWQPITFYFYETEVKLILLEIIFFAALAVFWFWTRKENRNLTYLGLMLGASFMPFISVRHNGLWSLLVFVPAAIAVSNIYEKRPCLLHTLPSLSAIILLLLFAGRAFALPRSYFDKNFIPVYAVDFIEEHNLRGPIFNLVNEGGYLIWRLWPQEKISIDSRSEVYIGKPLQEFLTVARGGENWNYLVDEKYSINYFIFSYRPRVPGESVIKLVQTLMRNNWVLVYWDDAAVIFVRNSKENKSLIDKYGLRHISPFRRPKDIPQKETAETLNELNNLIKIVPNSDAVKEYQKLFLDSRSPL